MGVSDKEMDILLGTLKKIRDEVGGGPEAEEGRVKGGSAEKLDKFTEAKTAFMIKLKLCCEAMDSNTIGADPKAIIAKNQEIRSHLKGLEGNWEEMNAAYQHERGKKRSKMSQEEMDARRQLLTDLKQEVAELKAIHQQGTVGGGAATGAAFSAVSSADVMKRPAMEGPPSEYRPPAQLTEQQHFRIQQIQERGKAMEETYLTKIEEHVSRLGDVARGMNEELQMQNRMLEDLDTRIEGAQEHMTNVNLKMKETLKKVRSADKFMIDVMCVLLLLGLIAVLYAVIKSS